mgnify:CR=1 FL=1
MTADGSPVLSPRYRSSLRLRSKRVKTDRAICQAGALLALMAVGRNIGDLRARDHSEPSTFSRHRSLTGKRSREFSPSHGLSWMNSFSSENSNFVSYDKQFSSPEQSPSEKSFSRVSMPKRPLSTPVLLKATFYHDSSPPSTFEDPYSPTYSSKNASSTSVDNSADSVPPTSSTLIDLSVFDSRDRRSRSLDSTELDRISFDTINDKRLKLTNLNRNSSDASLETIRDRLSSRSADTVVETSKLPPPPSPRLNSPMRELLSNHEPEPSRSRSRTKNLSESSSPVSLPSPGSDFKEKLSLLDVEAEGQTQDTTEPLLQPQTVKKTLSIKDLEREFVDSPSPGSATTAV